MEALGYRAPCPIMFDYREVFKLDFGHLLLYQAQANFSICYVIEEMVSIVLELYRQGKDRDSVINWNPTGLCWLNIYYMLVVTAASLMHCDKTSTESH
jgi:hypothetical protein